MDQKKIVSLTCIRWKKKIYELFMFTVHAFVCLSSTSWWQRGLYFSSSLNFFFLQLQYKVSFKSMWELYEIKVDNTRETQQHIHISLIDWLIQQQQQHGQVFHFTFSFDNNDCFFSMRTTGGKKSVSSSIGKKFQFFFSSYPVFFSHTHTFTYTISIIWRSKSFVCGEKERQKNQVEINYWSIH